MTHTKRSHTHTWFMMRDANIVLPSTITVPPPENLLINGTFVFHTTPNTHEERQRISDR